MVMKKVSKNPSKKPSNKTREVDFSGTSTGGRRRVPDGDYRLKVDKAYWDTSEAGNDMVVFEMLVNQGTHKGFRGWIHCAVTPKAIWKLRQVIEALGTEVPESRFSVNPAKFVGKECGGTIESEEYDGKKRSKITDVFPIDQLADEDSDDDEESDEEESSEEEGEEEETEEEDED